MLFDNLKYQNKNKKKHPGRVQEEDGRVMVFVLILASAIHFQFLSNPKKRDWSLFSGSKYKNLNLKKRPEWKPLIMF